MDRWYAGAVVAVATAEARGTSTEAVLAGLRNEGASETELTLLARTAHEVHRLDAAFAPYLPAVVARASGAGRVDAGRLGGEERVVSVLFGDLAGFTTFAESRPPTEVVDMLNAYWAAVVPAIDAGGGLIEHFAGDGVMAIFNAAGDQPDHARLRPGRRWRWSAPRDRWPRPIPGWPVFRVGVNTGPAVVGSVGSDARRSFAAIGDTTNTAARLMSLGSPGDVVVGRTTWEALHDELPGSPLGEVHVKGRRTPVEAWRLG